MNWIWENNFSNTSLAGLDCLRLILHICVLLLQAADPSVFAVPSAGVSGSVRASINTRFHTLVNPTGLEKSSVQNHTYNSTFAQYGPTYNIVGALYKANIAFNNQTQNSIKLSNICKEILQFFMTCKPNPDPRNYSFWHCLALIIQLGRFHIHIK